MEKVTHKKLEIEQKVDEKSEICLLLALLATDYP